MSSYRLNINEIHREDLPYIINWAKNKNITKYLHIDLPQNEQAANQWFARLQIDRTQDNFIINIVNDEGYKKPIGILGIYNIDEKNKKCEYYICIGDESFTRRGIAYRTSAEIIGNYFKTYNYNKIIASVDKDHLIGQKLAEKLGFKKEGLFTEDICLEDGTYIDRFVYGLTAAMWKDQR